jgi:hypothetical protein
MKRNFNHLCVFFSGKSQGANLQLGIKRSYLHNCKFSEEQKKSQLFYFPFDNHETKTD